VIRVMGPRGHRAHLLFLTSDNPVPIRADGMAALVAPVIHFLPVTPRLCLSVTPRGKPERLDKTVNVQQPSRGTIRRFRGNRDGVKRINQLTVQCAERDVFSSIVSAGVRRLVQNNGKFQVQMDYVELPGSEADTSYQGSVTRVREVV